MKYSKTTLMELSHKYRSILRKCALFNAAILMTFTLATVATAGTPKTDGVSSLFGDVSISNPPTIDYTAFGGRRTETWTDGKYKNDFPKYQMVGRSFALANGLAYVGPVTLTLRELTDADKLTYNYQKDGDDVDLAELAGVNFGDTQDEIIAGVAGVIGAANAEYTAPGVIAFANRDNSKTAGSMTFSNSNVVVDGATVNADSITVNNGSTLAFVKQDPALLGSALRFYAGDVDSDGKSVLNAKTINIDGSQVLVKSGAELTINATEGATIKNNTTTGDGGAINSLGTLTVNNTVFTDNQAGYGGAIENYGSSTHLTINNSTFSENKTTKGGGAIDNDGGAVVDINGGTKFTGNTSDGSIKNGFGGAIMNWEGSININGTETNKVEFSQNQAIYGSAIMSLDSLSVSNASFVENTASEYGGVYVSDGTASIEDSTFTSNTAPTGYGAAIANASHTTVKNSTFDQNSGNQGGTIMNFLYSKSLGETVDDVTLTVSDSTFSNNTTKVQGGAIDTFSVATISNTKFLNNKTTTSNDDGGGAMFVGAESITKITDSTFEGNSSASNGGAIMTRSADVANNVAAKLDIVNSDFTGNKAKNGFGGAVYLSFYNSQEVPSNVNIDGGSFDGNEAQLGGGVYISDMKDKGDNYASAQFKDVSWTNNIASSQGGALWVGENATASLVGTNTFSGNKAGGKANDIYNAGTLNVSGTMTLDGGIVNTDNGVLNFTSGTTLILADVLSGSTIISGGTIDANGATLDSTSFVVSSKGTYTFADSEFTSDFELSDSIQTAIDNNLLYDVTYSEGTFTVAEKEASDIAEDVIAGGATAQEANTIAAVANADSTHPVVGAVKEALQTGNVTAVAKAAEDLAPTNSQYVMGVAQSINTLLNNVTGTRMATLGKAGGDAFVGGSAWVQGLYNHSKQDASGNNAGFSANTKGIAFGVDGKVNEALTVGLGYSYTQTDADSRRRDVDVDGHNFFAYGQYQPNAWYVNTMLSYGLNKYTEKKNPMGIAMEAKYDVNTFAANVMTGYDFKNGITPEGGLRYLLADQKSYNDGLQHVSSDEDDVLTAVIGVKYATNLKAENWSFKPALRLAATYDVVSDNSKANVNVIGGGNYQITGDRLNRFGVETGVAVTSSVNDLDLTLEYNGGFRKDFQSHTGMLKAKYNF